MDRNKNEHIYKHNESYHQEGCCNEYSGNCSAKEHCNGRTKSSDGRKIPFNRQLSEEAIQKIKAYAEENNVNENEALEIAIKKLIFDAKNKNK